MAIKCQAIHKGWYICVFFDDQNNVVEIGLFSFTKLLTRKAQQWLYPKSKTIQFQKWFRSCELQFSKKLYFLLHHIIHFSQFRIWIFLPIYRCQKHLRQKIWWKDMRSLSREMHWVWIIVCSPNMQTQCLAEIFSNPNFTMCSILEPGNQSPSPPKKKLLPIIKPEFILTLLITSHEFYMALYGKITIWIFIFSLLNFS